MQFMQNVHKYANAKFFAFFAKSANTYLRMPEMPMHKGFHDLNTYLNTYLLETPLWKEILRGLR
jgi:hypothetical protein